LEPNAPEVVENPYADARGEHEGFGIEEQEVKEWQKLPT
jgi:hypothetical protein